MSSNIHSNHTLSSRTVQKKSISIDWWKEFTWTYWLYKVEKAWTLVDAWTFSILVEWSNFSWTDYTSEKWVTSAMKQAVLDWVNKNTELYENLNGNYIKNGT